jgi:hypothetical protein
MGGPPRAEYWEAVMAGIEFELFDAVGSAGPRPARRLRDRRHPLDWPLVPAPSSASAVFPTARAGEESARKARRCVVYIRSSKRVLVLRSRGRRLAAPAARPARRPVSGERALPQLLLGPRRQPARARARRASADTPSQRPSALGATFLPPSRPKAPRPRERAVELATDPRRGDSSTQSRGTAVGLLAQSSAVLALGDLNEHLTTEGIANGKVRQRTGGQQRTKRKAWGFVTIGEEGSRSASSAPTVEGGRGKAPRS